MSADKDLSAPIPTPGRARAQLAQLRQGALSLTVFGDTVTRVTRMGKSEVWTRVPGTGRGESGWLEKEGD